MKRLFSLFLLLPAFTLPMMAQAPLAPVIAVPDCPGKEHLVEMVRMAGCLPEEVLDSEEIDASSWDGAIMPEGWVATGEGFTIRFYKAIAGRNIPFIGTSSAAQRIDIEMKRLPYKDLSIEELATKALTFKRAKALMDGIFTIDTHCDLPENYSKGWSVGKKT